MTDVGVFKSPISEAMCWRISFTPAETSASLDLLPFITVQEPHHVLALTEQLDADVVLANQNLRDREAFYLIWLPRGGARSAELEKRAGDWVRSGARAEQPMVRASIRTVSVIWSENRAVIQAAEEELHSAMDAVIRFTLAVRETMILEQQSAATWTELEAHVPLTHQVSSRDFRMQRKVNSMTERATRMKASYFRLNNAVQQIDRTRTAPSKLLFSELAFQADLLQRIELLEPPTQFFLDHYELSNTRLIEGRFNRKLLLMECGIVLVLCAELAMFIVEVIQPLRPSKVVQTNAGAVHLGETSIKQKTKADEIYAGHWPFSSDQPHNLQTPGSVTEFIELQVSAPFKPATTKVVQTDTVAVHPGETLIKAPAPIKVTQAHAGAMYLGDALTPVAAITAHGHCPTVGTAAQAAGIQLSRESTTGTIPPASDTTVKPAPLPKKSNVSPKVQTLIPMPRPRMAESSVRDASTGAVRRDQEGQVSKIVPKAAQPDWNKINRKPGEQTVTAKRRAPTARSGTEQAPRVRPIVRKTKDNGDTTTAIAKPGTQVRDADYQRVLANQPKLAGKDPRRVRLAVSRVGDSTDLRRSIEQLNTEAMRALRSHCRQILSAPQRFARSDVEICTDLLP